MAVAFVQQVATSQSGGGSTTFGSGSTLATATVGQRIIVCVGYFGSDAITSCADSAGNTYSVDIVGNGGTGSVRIGILSAPVTTQLTVGGTITVTFAGTSNDWLNMIGLTVSGVATSSAVDTTNQTYQDDAPMASTNSNSSTADAIIVGCFAMRSGSNWAWTAGGSSTEVAETFQPNVNFAVQYRVITATGNNNSSGAWNGTDNLDGVAAHVIYKGAGPTQSQRFMWMP